MALTFTWDRRKAAANVRRHGVSFHATLSAFGDTLSLTIPDEQHSEVEERYLLLGRPPGAAWWWWRTRSRGAPFGSSAPACQRGPERRNYEDA